MGGIDNGISNKGGLKYTTIHYQLFARTLIQILKIEFQVEVDELGCDFAAFVKRWAKEGQQMGTTKEGIEK